MPSKNTIVECEVCKRSLQFGSLRKHKTNVHNENIPAKIQVELSPYVAPIIPFSKIDDKEPAKILLKKIQGCKKDFNGTKSAMQLYFSFEECELLIDCVKCVLEKKEKEITQAV